MHKIFTDHCRIGSLEMADVVMRIHAERSLPHRQLRKQSNVHYLRKLGSLPHRQLRNKWLSYDFDDY